MEHIIENTYLNKLHVNNRPTLKPSNVQLRTFRVEN